jgi:hypothetical protein
MTRSSFLLTLALAITGVAAISPVQAAPTVNAYVGNTTVALSPALLNALSSLHVAPSRQFPGELTGATARFPISTGQIDLATAHGEIVHSGGLNLKSGNTTVTLSDFVIDTTGSAPVLTGLVTANGDLVARLPLFDITLTQAPVIKNYGVAGQVIISGAALSLTTAGATALNQAFNVTAFSQGIPIGNASVNALTFNPSVVR